MSEPVLTVLKFCLLALVYLFLGRVVWVVVRELRGTPAIAGPGGAPTPATTPPTARRRGWRLAGGPNPEGTWIEGEATIGRGGGCTISLPADTYASQVHARVVERGGDLWIEDLDSTNGTYVNGTRVTKPTRLRKGDRVQAGETVFEVQR
jgi:hypothetical protein